MFVRMSVLALASTLASPVAAACTAPATNALELVRLAEVTHTARASGDWSDPATWTGNRIPGDGARVHIPAGTEVTLDDISARLETVRIDGTLSFDTTSDTGLRVDTLVSTMMGTLEIGTAGSPVASNVDAKVVFIDDGPLDTTCDPNQLGRGALLMGRTEVHGAERVHRAVLASPAVGGDGSITLDRDLDGWQIGDEIVVTGTIAGDPESDEVRTISSITGRTVQLDSPLMLDHTAPAADLDVYVANMTRNVEFLSESGQTARRGHVMFVHTLDVDVDGARFHRLGRTDKTRPLDDFLFDFDDDVIGNSTSAPVVWTMQTGRRTNVRGRYPVHFHRGGVERGTQPAVVRGSVVKNGPGWGFVMHSAHVHFIDNVSYDLQGAGFYTEAGDEVGLMQGNIAIRTVNRVFRYDSRGGAIDPDLRQERMDYGNDGDGYWLTGQRVALIDNVSAGASAHGFIYWTDGIIEPDVTPAGRSRVLTADLHPAPAALLGNRTSIPTWWAPLAEVRDNVSYGASIGFRARYIHAQSYLGEGGSSFHRRPSQRYIDSLRPTIDGLTVWNNRDGVMLNYTARMNLRNARIVGIGTPAVIDGGTANSGVGLDLGTEITSGFGRIEHVDISGFDIGFVTPRNDQWVVDDLTLRNRVDLFINEPRQGPRTLTMDNVSFGPLTGTAVEGQDNRRRYAFMEPLLDEASFQPYFFVMPDRITVNGIGVYFAQQRSNYVPLPRNFPRGDTFVRIPSAYVGQTNAQLQSQFGLSLGGALLPANARQHPRLDGGRIGTAAPAAMVLPELYDMTGEGFAPEPVPGNPTPQFTVNHLRVEPGRRVTLMRDNLHVIDSNSAPADIQYTVSQVQHGYFEHRDAPGAAITDFLQAEIDGGVIRFVHDGSANPPSYTVQASDGSASTPSVPVEVEFVLP